MLSPITVNSYQSPGLLSRLGFVTRSFYDYVLKRFGISKEERSTQEKDLHQVNVSIKPQYSYKFFDPAGYFYTAAGSNYAKRSLSKTELETALKSLEPKISLITKLNGHEIFFVEPKKKSKQPFALFPGMRGTAYYKISGIKNFIENGIPILIGDYRGMGSSYGKTEINRNTLVEDGIRVLEEQLKRSLTIGAVGHSLGTAIISKALAEISAHKKISGHLILISGWDVFSEVFSSFPGFLAKPFGMVLKFLSNKIFGDVWDSGNNLCKTIDNIVEYLQKHPHENNKLKIDLLHGDKDSIVLLSQGLALEKKLKDKIASLPKHLQDRFEVNFHVFKDGGHFHDFEGSNQLPWQSIISLIIPKEIKRNISTQILKIPDKTTVI